MSASTAAPCRRDFRLEICDQLSQPRGRVERLEPVLPAAFFQAREVEDVFDEAGQPVALLDDHLEIASLFLWVGHAPVKQHPAKLSNPRQGGAEFVGDRRDEIRPQPGDLEFPSDDPDREVAPEGQKHRDETQHRDG